MALEQARPIARPTARAVAAVVDSRSTTTPLSSIEDVAIAIATTATTTTPATSTSTVGIMMLMSSMIVGDHHGGGRERFSVAGGGPWMIMMTTARMRGFQRDNSKNPERSRRNPHGTKNGGKQPEYPFHSFPKNKYDAMQQQVVVS
jgi:hypothetical protein